MLSAVCVRIKVISLRYCDVEPWLSWSQDREQLSPEILSLFPFESTMVWLLQSKKWKINSALECIMQHSMLSNSYTQSQYTLQG